EGVRQNPTGIAWVGYGRFRSADDLTQVVDGQGEPGRSLQRAHVSHDTLAPEEGMLARLADHLAEVVDPERLRVATAGQGAEIPRHAFVPQRGMELLERGVDWERDSGEGAARDLPAVVEGVGRAERIAESGHAAKRAEVIVPLAHRKASLQVPPAGLPCSLS